MTLGVGVGTLVVSVIVGTSGTSAVMGIVLGASGLTALLSLVALPSRMIRDALTRLKRWLVGSEPRPRVPPHYDDE